MGKKNRLNRKVLFVRTLMLAAVLAGTWLVWHSFASAPADQQVRQSWSLMQQTGRYDFSSTVEQTTYPAPALVNVGRSSTKEVYYASGTSDLSSRTMQIGLWQNAGSVLNNQDKVEVRVEGDRAFGRMVNADWQELKNFSTSSFAPGQDASAFLVAAQNTHLVGAETISLPDGVERQVSRYAFNLDSGRFSAYMRDQMVAQLQRAGKLPLGMDLGVSDAYKGMEGEGALWVDGTNLPIRLQVAMKMPPSSSGERVEIHVTTDFYNHARENLLAKQPFPIQIAGMLNLPTTRSGLGQLALVSGFSALLLALVALATVFSRSRVVYALVAALVVVSMLVSPLWQSAAAANFNNEIREQQKSSQAAQEAAAGQRDQERELLTSQWDAKQNPLQAASSPAASTTSNSSATSTWAGSHAQQTAPVSDDAAVDSDGDGLTDAFERQANADAPDLGTMLLNPASADTDSDGLNDGQEVSIGLSPAKSDTDGDGISDLNEVTGFYYGSDTWYSNPLEKDTDKDGILDGTECSERATSATGICHDTDLDGIPDIFDTDDDGDGVPTIVDASPYSVDTAKLIYTGSRPLNFSVSSMEPDRTVLITYQVRPTQAAHLTYAMNVLDWPAGDTDGQIQRVSGNTFGSNLSEEKRAADPRASNGDMRLIPMLEVTLKGSTLPLPLTNQFTFTVNDGSGSGAGAFDAGFSLIAQSETETQLRVDHVNNWGGAMSVVLASGNCAQYTGGTTYNGLADGASVNVQTPLGTLADGGRVLLVKKGDGSGVLGCGVIPPVAHGSLTRDVVDDALLGRYGASARQNSDGSVIVYAPLSLVHTTGGDVGVAFSSTIPFTNEGNRIASSSQDVRVVWLINMLTDVCKPQPADYTGSDWCSASQLTHWYTDLPTVVHTYNDDFYLTGLSVSEERGLDMAVVFEDPLNDPQPAYDDPIWMLAKGLESSFVAGRLSSGGRDMTVHEIEHRFDPDNPGNNNGDIPAGDARLWGQAKNAFQVERYQYGFADEVYKFVETEADAIFADHFTNLPAGQQVSEAMLLFAREENRRQVTLDEVSSSNCNAAGCRLDFANSSLMTTAVLNWSPYQYKDGKWQPYPLESYLDLLESKLRSLDTFLPEDNTDEAREVVDGQINMARLYCQGLFRGISKLVALDGNPLINNPDVVDDNNMVSLFYDDQGKYVTIAKVTQFVAKRILEGIQSLVKMNQYTGIHGIRDLYRAFKTGDNQPGMMASIAGWSKFSKVMLGIAVAIVVVVMIGSFIWSLVSPNSAEGRIAGQVFRTGLGLITAGIMLKAAYGAYQVYKAGQFAASAASKAAIIGAVIGAVITWGVFIYAWVDSGVAAGSLAANNMAADAIATTCTLVLMAILASTGVGAIIVAIIGLIDAIITAICAAAGWDQEGADSDMQQYFCIGISGWVTKIIKWTIYGVQFLINYDDSSRLAFSNLDQDVTDPLKGMTTGNKLTASLKVTNNIKLSDIPFDWKAAFYFWQYSDSNAKSSSFVYKLQPTETDIHGSVERYQNSGLWVDDGSHQWKGEFTAATDAVGINMPAPGINRDPTIYFSEGSAVPVQECIAIPALYGPFFGLWPICWVRTEKGSTHSALGTNFTMDVFPNTLDEFYKLTTTATGAQTLAWGQDATLKFPAQKDADGDSLLSRAVTGGNDPDDSRFDSDNDGISDAGELREGTNPLLYDSDDDGLWDAEELALGTSPVRKDTDGDGLTDKEEMDGWLFTYGFEADGTPLETLVVSDPLTPDLDGDGLTDFQERLYGFNPRVFSIANVLDYALSMREQDSPLVMLSLDETGSPMIFSDSSNFNYPASCATSDLCPSSVSGQYAGAALFDSSDALSLTTSAGSIAFAGDQRPFTLGAWVYRQGGGTLISKWSDSTSGQQDLRLSLSGSGQIVLDSSTSSAGSSSSVAADTWTHVAVSYNGTQAAFYINGAPAGTSTWSDNPTFGAGTSPSPVMVGAYQGASAPAGFFSGRLDEVAVFDRALSEQEIQTRLVQALYNFNDSYVRPGERVNYTSTVTNLLNSRFAYGFLTNTIDRVEAVVNWAAHLLPRTFTLDPDNPSAGGANQSTWTNTLEIAADAGSGPLTLSQKANAQIVDLRSESNRAELWLKFDTSDKLGAWADFSGNMPRRDATCAASACPTTGQTGVLSEAVLFSADQNTPVNTVTLGRMKLIDRGYTVSMWVKPAESTTAGTQMNLFASAGDRLVLALDRVDSGAEAGNFAPTISVNGSPVSLSTGRNLIRGLWNHLAVQYNDVTDTLRVYVNGAPSASASSVASVTLASGTTDAAAWIGGSPQGGNYWVDDVRIFSRPLSLLDINRLAERPVLKLYMEGDTFGDSSDYGQSVTAPTNGVPLPAHDTNAIRGRSMTPGSGGSLGYLMVTGNSLLDLQDGAFTVSTWVYPVASGYGGPWEGIWGKKEFDNTPVAGDYPTLERQGANLRFGFDDGVNTDYQYKTSSNVLTENRWNHIVVTFAPTETSPVRYAYKLYVNAALKDSNLFNTAPRSASSFFVGHSSQIFKSGAMQYHIDSSDDAGSHAEPYLDIRLDGNYYGRVWGGGDGHDTDMGETVTMNVERTLYGNHTISYIIYEDDDTSADDYCGEKQYAWYNFPSNPDYTTMSNGFEGWLQTYMSRPSIYFRGSIDEMEMYRYALDSEQIYDLYNSIPITARLPLDDRPASNSFENLAAVGSQDNGKCGADCPAAGLQGLINQAVRFDGSNDEIQVDVTTTDDYMVSLWVNTTCASCGIYSLETNTAILQQIYLRSGNICSKVGTTSLCTRGGGYADGEWHHVVYANNGSVANLWMDGQIVSALANPPQVSPVTGEKAHLGHAVVDEDNNPATPSAINPTLNGQLDDVRVFLYSQAEDVVAQLNRRAPLLLAHLNETDLSGGMQDATFRDWYLECASPSCPLAGTQGRLGSALQFDGQDDVVQLHQTELSADLESFTISLWVMPVTKVSHVQTLWAAASTANNAYKFSLAIAPDSMAVCILDGQTGSACTAQSNAELVMNNWNFITLVVQRGTDRESYQLYINGYLDSSGDRNVSTFVEGMGRLVLGNILAGYSSQQGGAFAGKIDEVSLYTYMLNEIDVRDAFQYQMSEVEEHDSLAMTIDAGPPEARLVSYNPDVPDLMQHDVMLQVEATDAVSGVSRVEMNVQYGEATNNDWQVAPLCQDSASGTSFCPTFVPGEEGVYHLTFRAVDRVGNRSNASSYVFYVDGQGPHISTSGGLSDGSLQPARLDMEKKHTWFLALSGKVSDLELAGTRPEDHLPGSGVDLSSVRITIYSQAGAPVGDGTQIPTLVHEENDEYQWSLNYTLPEKEPTGKLTVVIEARDKAGNNSTRTFSLLVDATSPVATLRGGLPLQPVNINQVSAEDPNPILVGGVLNGTSSDLPEDGLPYITEEGKAAASNVEKVEVSFAPGVEASALFNEPYPDGLLAWLPLDSADVPLDSQGNPDPQAGKRLFLDISPYQMTGDCDVARCPDVMVTAHKAGSAYFNGNFQYINLGQQVDLAQRSFTVSVWAQRDQAGHADPILWQGPVSMPDQRFLFGLDGENRFVCGFGGVDLKTPDAFPDNGWHAWACTYDLATQARAIYRDGVMVASDTSGALPRTSENLYLGLAPVGSFKGSLDEMVILDHALDAPAVRALFTGYQSVYHLAVDSDFLVNGSPVTDRSGYFQAGTLEAADIENRVVPGAAGDYALRFNGGDRVVVPSNYSLRLERGAFTQTAWVYPEGADQRDILSERDENPEQRYPSLFLTGDNRLMVGFGNGFKWTEVVSEPGVVPNGKWSHVAATFDGQVYTAYVDGAAVLSSTLFADQAPYPADRFNLGQSFTGAIDEVQIFTRALSDLEIQAMAAQGWSQAALAADLTWQSDVRAGLEGPYQIQIRGWDGLEHVRADKSVRDQWGGLVDTLAPRITLQKTMVAGQPFLAEYTFTIEDTMLDEATIRQNLCAEVTLEKEYYNSSWFLALGNTPPNSALYRVLGKCQGDIRTLEVTGVYACDQGGNCSAQTYPAYLKYKAYLPLVNRPEGSPSGNLPKAPPVDEETLRLASTWQLLSERVRPQNPGLPPSAEISTEQVDASSLRGLFHLNLRGRVSGEVGPFSVRFRLLQGDQEVYAGMAAVYGELWNGMWVFTPGHPPADGRYTLEVTVMDGAGQQALARREIVVDLTPRAGE